MTEWGGQSTQRVVYKFFAFWQPTAPPEDTKEGRDDGVGQGDPMRATGRKCSPTQSRRCSAGCPLPTLRTAANASSSRLGGPQNRGSLFRGSKYRGRGIFLGSLSPCGANLLPFVMWSSLRAPGSCVCLDVVGRSLGCPFRASGPTAWLLGLSCLMIPSIISKPI